MEYTEYYLRPNKRYKCGNLRRAAFVVKVARTNARVYIASPALPVIR